MSSNNRHQNAAHQSAVSDILSSRRQALQWLMKLSVAKNIDWESPIIRQNTTQFSQHPQRPAHGYTLLYAQNVANKSYWPQEKDLFTEHIKTPDGDVYKAEVPVQQDYQITTTDYDVSNLSPTLADLDTERERISLETLNYYWQNRQVDVTVHFESPYTDMDTTELQIDLWLPPKAISLAFKQLDELAASLDFLAEASDELPTWGFEEVDEDEYE